MTRRSVMEETAAVGVLAATGDAVAQKTARARAQKPKKILILGGTGFIGPQMIDVALARGHTVTIFNRGKTRPNLVPSGAEKLVGDRDGKLDALKGRKWDAVIDNSGYVPRVVRQSAELLASNVQQYIFISTVSVYPDVETGILDEAHAVQTLPEAEKQSGEVRKHYGALKAACEKEVARALPKKTMVFRPGLIVGPDDPTDRFTYWPVRADRGGEMIAPGDGKDPMQVIDVRDLAAWVIHSVEQKLLGTFNALGPEQSLPVSQVVDACVAAASTKPTVTWIPAAFLEQHKVMPWQDMPAWIPRNEKGPYGFSNKKAVAAGLNFRPIAETCRDTLAWWKGLPEERRNKPKWTMTAAREEEVLKAWRARAPTSPSTDAAK